MTFEGFEGFLLLEDEDIETCFLTGDVIFAELEDEELLELCDFLEEEIGFIFEDEVTELELELEDFFALALDEDLFGEELEWLLEDELLEDQFCVLSEESSKSDKSPKTQIAAASPASKSNVLSRPILYGKICV